MNNLLVLLFLLFFAYNSDAQSSVLSGIYKTDVLVGSNTYGWESDTKSITLNTDNISPWGYFIDFKEDGTFLAYNQNKCGNDCRIKVTGTYLISENQIVLTSNSIRYLDICATRPKVVTEELLGVFSIEDMYGQIILRKV
jgi:hypothetical protein